MRIPIGGEIQSDYRGYGTLLDVAEAIESCFLDTIEIDMSNVTWLDANMCAPLGAILYKAGRDLLNDVTVTNTSSPVEAILSRNGFLCSYGRARKPDAYGTTIEYKRFEPNDDHYFGHYIETHLLIGKGIPPMSPGLLKKFRESIFEIFSNAVIHSKTELGIFSCGQYYPTKKKLDFSVADLGIGIPHNVREVTGKSLSPDQAINWAMEGTNTTKRGPIPGGLGLKLLREFIAMNDGRMHIVSDSGYWEFSGGQVQQAVFAKSFPGTVVNVEINAADIKSYRLVSEVQPEDVF